MISAGKAGTAFHSSLPWIITQPLNHIKPQSAPPKEGGLKSHRNTFGPWPLRCLCSTLFNLPCWIMLDCNVAPFTPMTCLQLKLTTAIYTELPWWSNMRARLKKHVSRYFCCWRMSNSHWAMCDEQRAFINGFPFLALQTHCAYAHAKKQMNIIYTVYITKHQYSRWASSVNNITVYIADL